MNALARLIMKVMMWGAFLIGLVLSGLCAAVYYAIQNGTGADGGISAGKNPEVGLAVMAGLALVAFILAFVVRREIKRHA